MADINSTVDPNQATVDSTVDPTQATVDSTVDPTQATVKSTVDSNQATVDSTVDPTQATVKSTVDSNQATVDSTVDPTQATVDSTVDQASLPEFLTIEELKQRYGIGKHAVYKRLEYLELKPIKDGSRSLFNSEQVACMDGLHEYIKEKGKMNGFIKPEQTKPQELLDIPVEAEATTTQLDSSAIVPLVEGAISPEISSEGEFIPVGAVSPHMTNEEMEAIDRQAQFIAAGRYVATQELADYYANTGEFSLPEVIERVRDRRLQTQQQWEAAHKSADPKALAQTLIARAKQKARGQEKSTVA